MKRICAWAKLKLAWIIQVEKRIYGSIKKTKMVLRE